MQADAASKSHPINDVRCVFQRLANDVEYEAIAGTVTKVTSPHRMMTQVALSRRSSCRRADSPCSAICNNALSQTDEYA